MIFVQILVYVADASAVQKSILLRIYPIFIQEGQEASNLDEIGRGAIGL